MSELENEKLESTASSTDEVTAAQETVQELAQEAVTEAVQEAPKKKAAMHMTASAAALNAEGEVDIRRRKSR